MLSHPQPKKVNIEPWSLVKKNEEVTSRNNKKHKLKTLNNPKNNQKKTLQKHSLPHETKKIYSQILKARQELIET